MPQDGFQDLQNAVLDPNIILTLISAPFLIDFGWISKAPDHQKTFKSVVLSSNFEVSAEISLIRSQTPKTFKNEPTLSSHDYVISAFRSPARSGLKGCASCRRPPQKKKKVGPKNDQKMTNNGSGIVQNRGPGGPWGPTSSKI